MHTYIITTVWLSTKTHPTMCHKISAALSPFLTSISRPVFLHALIHSVFLVMTGMAWWTRAFDSTTVGAAANVWKTPDDGIQKRHKTLYPDLSEPHTYQPTSATRMSLPDVHRCTHAM